MGCQLPETPVHEFVFLIAARGKFPDGQTAAGPSFMASIRPLPRDEFWARGQNWQDWQDEPRPPARVVSPSEGTVARTIPISSATGAKLAASDGWSMSGPNCAATPSSSNVEISNSSRVTFYATTTGGLAVRSARMDSSTQPSLSVLVPSFSLEDTGQVLTVLARVGQGCS